MIISGEEIRACLGDRIAIEPFDQQFLNANSYDLSLHHEMLVYEEVVLDAASPNRYRRVEIPESGLTLQPGLLYLGRTVEHTETRGLVPMIRSRSSIGRLGLVVNPGGSIGDAGYCGTWTLEMHCVQPVRIYPGMRICQIYYLQMHGAPGQHEPGKYQHSAEIQPSLMYKELGGSADDAQLELDFDRLVSGTQSR